MKGFSHVEGILFCYLWVRDWSEGEARLQIINENLD
jgi:hypothetical protein